MNYKERVSTIILIRTLQSIYIWIVKFQEDNDTKKDNEFKKEISSIVLMTENKDTKAIPISFESKPLKQKLKEILFPFVFYQKILNVA